MGETRAGLERLMVQTSASRERQVKQKVEIWEQEHRDGPGGCGHDAGEGRNSWEDEAGSGGLGASP